MRFPLVDREGRALTYTGAAPPVVVVGASREDDMTDASINQSLGPLSTASPIRPFVRPLASRCEDRPRSTLAFALEVHTETIGTLKGYLRHAQSGFSSMPGC